MTWTLPEPMLAAPVSDPALLPGWAGEPKSSLLISDLLQHYGLAEPPQISRNGSIIASG